MSVSSACHFRGRDGRCAALLLEELYFIVLVWRARFVGAARAVGDSTAAATVSPERCAPCRAWAWETFVVPTVTTCLVYGVGVLLYCTKLVVRGMVKCEKKLS